MVLGPYWSIRFLVLIGPGLVRLQSFSSLVTGLPNTNYMYLGLIELSLISMIDAMCQVH